MSRRSTMELHEHVHAALQAWHKDSSGDSPLGYLTILRRVQREGATTKQAANELIYVALETLERKWAPDADLLRKRFFDRHTVQALAARLNVGESTVFKLQRQAIDRLVEVLLAMEHEVSVDRQGAIEERLGEPTNFEVFGIEEPLSRLGDVLAALQPPWLISIEGIGGIGKTTLADMLVRQIMSRGIFADFGWVSAQPSLFSPGGSFKRVDTPTLTADALLDSLARQLMGAHFTSASLTRDETIAALQSRLRQRPHLIVIDNLETVLDIETLLPIVRRLMGPTKFVLTSRDSLYREPDVYHFLVPELSEPDALRLIRQEAHIRNLVHVLAGSDDELKAIYDTVGGNPLALRLVVGQTHVHSLDVILDSLATARGEKAENLYTYIYRQAWDSLDELTRRAFLAMPLVSEHGGDLNFLADISQLEPAALERSLELLVTRNLVDARGTLSDRRYTIHNLTRTFLHEQVIKWQAARLP